MLKHYKHNPAHLFLDNQMYFITAAIYKSRNLLLRDDIKENLLDNIKDFCSRIQWQFDHWVILNNHYHFSVKSYKGEDLSYLMGNVHRKTAKIIRSKCNVAARRVWWNYWDYCPRNEQDYLRHLNYMLYNPVKHGLVDDLKNYKWSSFVSLFNEEGHDKISRQFKFYGYKDTGTDFEKDDGF